MTAQTDRQKLPDALVEILDGLNVPTVRSTRTCPTRHVDDLRPTRPRTIRTEGKIVNVIHRGNSGCRNRENESCTRRFDRRHRVREPRHPVLSGGNPRVETNDLVTVSSPTGTGPELTDVFGRYEGRTV